MAKESNSKPNIVFILSDDHGAWAMGCAGNKDIDTPNLDRLAEAGMRFENFFCTSPVCSPARASLLTGKIPSQHGVHDWISDGNVGEQPIKYLQNQSGYTDILANQGYTCGISGKWHLGDSLQPQKGFSRWYVHQKGGGPYYNPPMIKNGERINEPGYVTDNITDDALQFLDDQSSELNPFYLSVHYTAPHSPWIDNHPKVFTDMYADCAFQSCPQEPLHPWHTELTDQVQENPQENLKGYFAAVTAMDENIGRILDKLDHLGLRENTLVCYMGDNGFSCGQHGFWGKGNGTFPLNMYDTSVKVPAIMSHLGHIPEGHVCDTLLSQYDFMPTLLAYIGIGQPENDQLPGKSFVNALQGYNENDREKVVVFDEYGPVRMIRTKEWKYIHRYPYGPHELYDLVHDPEETVDKIKDDTKQDIVRDLRTQLDDWFVRFVDPKVDGVRQPVTGSGQRSRSQFG